MKDAALYFAAVLMGAFVLAQIALLVGLWLSPRAFDAHPLGDLADPETHESCAGGGDPFCARLAGEINIHDRSTTNAR